MFKKETILINPFWCLFCFECLNFSNTETIKCVLKKKQVENQTIIKCEIRTIPQEKNLSVRKYFNQFACMRDSLVDSLTHKIETFQRQSLKKGKWNKIIKSWRRLSIVSGCCAHASSIFQLLSYNKQNFSEVSKFFFLLYIS